jgi:hypothetical protein
MYWINMGYSANTTLQDQYQKFWHNKEINQYAMSMYDKACVRKTFRVFDLGHTR